MNIDLEAGIYGTEIGNKILKKTLFCLKFSLKKLYFTKNNLLKKPLFSKEPARGPAYISWSSDFALYLRPYQIGGMVLWIHVQSDAMNDLILFVGHCDLYFMVQ